MEAAHKIGSGVRFLDSKREDKQFIQMKNENSNIVNKAADKTPKANT